MKRRDFITLLGGAAAVWPCGALAQQPTLPLVGFLHISTPGAWVLPIDGFRQGLRESGYIEGHNVAIEYRWAESHFDRLPALAADLVRRNAAVIFASGPPAVRALKAQTATIPIVFFMGEDPIREGLVDSLNRPGGQVTGVTNFQNLLFGKQIGLLQEIVPKGVSLAFLVNPNNPNAEFDTKQAQAAAHALRTELRVLTARTEDELERAFAALVEPRVGGLVVGVDGLFFDRREQLFALAARYVVPAIYNRRDYPVAGGLMSYGASPVDSYRQAAIYVGRILKGEKPANLPVQQSTKFELVINMKTAKALGLTIPPGILAISDEVIE